MTTDRLCFLVIIIAQLWTESSSAPLVIRAPYYANNTACYINGQTFQRGDLIPSEHPCEICRCRPPGFSCSLKHCPIKPGCRPMEVPGQCCPEFDCGCIYNGMIFHEGQKIPHSPTPCVTCYCRANIVRCGFNECKFRFDCEPEYVPRQCCPRYEHCHDKVDNFKSFDASDPLNETLTKIRPAMTATNLAHHHRTDGINSKTTTSMMEERGSGVTSSSNNANSSSRKKKLISHFIEDQANDTNVTAQLNPTESIETTQEPERVTSSRQDLSSLTMETVPPEKELTTFASDEIDVLTESAVSMNDIENNQVTDSSQILTLGETETTTQTVQVQTEPQSLEIQPDFGNLQSPGYITSIYKGSINLLSNLFWRFG